MRAARVGVCLFALAIASTGCTLDRGGNEPDNVCLGPCIGIDGGPGADVDAATLSDAQSLADAASDAGSPPLDPDGSGNWWNGALPEPYLCGQPGLSAKAELHLGHTDRIRTLKRSARRVLSQDAQGRWLLWDSETRRPLVEGTAREDSEQKPGSRVDLAGNAFAVPVIAGVELRELETGAVRVVIPTTDTFGLAQDGSYVWASSALGLTVWSAAGVQLFSRPGNYATAQIYAAPTELRIGKGPAGAQVIERIATLAGSDSTPTLSLPFLGEFQAWFDDGERFVTRVDGTVRVYSQAVVEQRRIEELPSGSVGGHGNYLWTLVNDQGPLCAYPVLGEEPKYCVQAPARASAEGFAGGVLLRYGERTAFSADGLDLTGEKPAALSFALPTTFTTLAADASGRWVLGDNDGAIAVGDALSKSASFLRLGCGRVLSLAGGGSQLAMATADGVLRLFSVEADMLMLRASYPLLSTALALSADGSLLAAGKTLAEQTSYYVGDQSLRLLGLPADTLQQLYPQQMSQQSGGLFEFALAASGTRLARVSCSAAAAAGSCRLLVSDPRGQTTQLDLTFNVAIESESPPIRVALGLSPDGRTVALSYAAPGSDWLHAKTWVYRDGQLSGTIDGVLAGFASDEQLVISTAKEGAGYTSALTTLQGVQVAPLGESLARGASAVDATHFFIASENTLYTLADGQQAWSGARLGGDFQRGTTLSGSRIVYTTDHRIALYTWQ